MDIYLGEQLITEQQEDRFKNHLEEKPSFFVNYFRQLRDFSQSDHIHLFGLFDANIDILVGNDKSTINPFNSGVVWGSFKKIMVNYRPDYIKKLSSVLDYAGGITKYADINNAR